MSVDTSNLSFEEALEQLETIVNKLQAGNIPLEESLTAFQDGMTLSKFCSDTLQNAEETMNKLITEDGEIQELTAVKHNEVEK